MLDVVITTDSALLPEQVAELEAVQFSITQVMGPMRYRVRGSGSRQDLEQVAHVIEVADTSATDKLDRVLTDALETPATVTTTASAAEADRGEPAPIPVLCSLDPDGDVDATVRALEQLGTVRDRSGRRLIVEVAPTRLSELTALPGLVAAEIEPRNETSNNVARGLTTVSPVADDFGLDGSSEIVGVADSGLDTGVDDVTMHPDFAGRIVNLRSTVDKSGFGVADAADLNNHGTHVSGSILGSGAKSNGNMAGMAPGAQVTMLSMGSDNSGGLSVPLDLVTGVFDDAYADGARLHNNSWSSSGSSGQYLASSRDVDEFIRDHPDMLILFAAGNEGPAAGSVSAPGTAKNCLTVGACESVRPLPASITIDPNIQDHDHNPATAPVNVPLTIPGWDLQADDVDEIAPFSGRGPTDDGRIKPDIVAPGTFILSCRSQVSTADVGPDGLFHGPGLDGFYADDADGVATHAEAVGNGLPGAPHFGAWMPNTPDAPAGSGTDYQDWYFYSDGTSMATPVTTGATALLRQHLRQQRNHEPSAALLKAMLVNGARVPAGQSPAPNNERGFGWLDLDGAIRPAPTGRQAYSDNVDLAVATGDIRNFDVQLADTSEPFRVTLAYTDRQGPGIQNSLYLRVIQPGGAIIDGDVTAFPTVSNNVQRVHIENPVAGTYTVQVHGVSVLFGINAYPDEIRQDFAIAVSNGVGFSPDPVDICQVIDHSGSMGFYGYMDPVKDRAQQLVGMLRVDDRAGAVAFDHLATDVHDVVPILGFATQQAINDQIELLGPGGMTSIGGGLGRGLSKLAAGGDPAHAQALVLLSDGHENTPPWVGGGVTGSPPSWYRGSDTTEVLPSVPANLRVYTVSLGVQSDEVLLQDIAMATGGTFHAIHGPADIGELHEIYVHLQAAADGEAVVAAGSSSVASFETGGAGTREGVSSITLRRQADGINAASLIDLRRLPDLREWWRRQSARVHIVPVDDTVESMTFMVSWHDPSAPVELTLASPTGRLYRPGTSAALNVVADGYAFFRVESPEVGPWTMKVIAGKRLSDLAGAHPYTFGAYARTPIHPALRLPDERVGRRTITLAARLTSERLARTVSFQALLAAATTPLKVLIEEYHDELEHIAEGLKPDAPTLEPALFGLGLLDQKRRAAGKPSLFVMKTGRLKLTRTTDYQQKVDLPVAGLHRIDVTAVGSTRGGTRYQRQIRSSMRT